MEDEGVHVWDMHSEDCHATYVYHRNVLGVQHWLVVLWVISSWSRHLPGSYRKYGDAYIVHDQVGEHVGGVQLGMGGAVVLMSIIMYLGETLCNV